MSLRVILTLYGWVTWISCLELPSARAQTSPATLPDLQLSKAGAVYAITVQEDGKVIIGGRFNSVNGLARTNIARVNRDGTVDTTWSPNAGEWDPNGSDLVDALCLIGSDLYIGGYFTNVGGLTRIGLAKLRTTDNGTTDSSWNFALTFQGREAGTAALAANGQDLYVGGLFDTIGGISRSGLAKLKNNGTGTVDPVWNPSPSNSIAGNYAGVFTMVSDGADLFVGGRFTAIGGRGRTNLAKLTLSGTGDADLVWNISINYDNTDILALALGDTNLYVGGVFDILNGIPGNNLGRLTTTGTGADLGEWNPNVDGAVNALAVSGTNLFIGGYFNNVGGLSRKYFAKVMTANRSFTDPNFIADTDLPLYSLALDGTRLYAGGSFNRVNTNVSLSMAKVDPVTGTRDASFPVQVQTPGFVEAIAQQPDGKLIIGGDFWLAGGLERRNLVRLSQDGVIDATWVPDPDGPVGRIVVNGTDVYVTGRFTSVGGQGRKYLAKLTTAGTDAADPIWNPDPDDDVDGMVVFGRDLYVGGAFARIGGQVRHGLAKLSPAGSGMADPAWKPELMQDTIGVEVKALVVDGTNLFIGGSFASVGGLDRTNLAKISLLGSGAVDPQWNPSMSDYLEGQGLGAYVEVIALNGSDLYVGGVFENIGGLNRTNLAKLTTTGAGAVDPLWNPNPNGPIVDLAVNGVDVYVAGKFSFVGAQMRQSVAKVSAGGAGMADTGWHPNPNGTVVWSLVHNGPDLYVAGNFTSIGGAIRYGLAFLPVADAPSMVKLSPTNLVILRNPKDGYEVTHFQITGITGGILYPILGFPPPSLKPSDSVRPGQRSKHTGGGVIQFGALQPGDFITTEQGEAGLVFEGASNGTVTAVSSLNSTPAGTGTASTTLNFAAPQPPVLSFDKADYAVAEDVAGSIFTLTVRKLGPGDATVSYEVQSGTAEPYDVENETGDYLVLTDSPLIFASSNSTKAIHFLIKNDTNLEGDETFMVTLTGASGGIVAYPGIVRVTIIDDECPGQHGPFTNTALPSASPAVTGALEVNIPEPATAQWRLAGDPVWRAPGSTATGLVPGFYKVLFKRVLGFRDPEPVTIQISVGMTTTFSGLYAREATNAFGDLIVNIAPDAVATNSNPDFRGQWRISGGPWQDSDARLHLVAGFYTVEFKAVSGVSAPLTAIAQVVANEPVIKFAAYEPESGPGPVLPAALSVNVVTSTPPYCYNGLIESEDGFGSGVVVKERVVLTAAHVLFDDTRLSYAKRVRWFLQKHHGDYEPPGQMPRGWYVFDGYAARRTNDNSPGISSPASQSFDTAAMYFVGTNQTDNLPGRGGYGGFLSSTSATNEWLVSSRLKMLVGYPLEGVAETNQGRMHATVPADLIFTKPYPQINNQVYATTSIASRPGNSGGPVYVQADDSTYYPTGIYLGGGSQTLVRAIDETVVCLINAAEVSGDGGGNNTGGGVTLWSPGLTVDEFQVGLVRVTLGPRNAVLAGAAWRVNRGGGDVSAYLASADTVYPLVPGPIPIEFKPVPGFGTPMPLEVHPVANDTVPVDVVYPVFDLSNATHLPGGAFRLTLSGVINRLYSIEITADLTNWSTLTTLTNQIGTILFTNQPPPIPPQRFYRGREIQ